MDFGFDHRKRKHRDSSSWDYDLIPSDSDHLAFLSDSSSDSDVSSQCSSTDSTSSNSVLAGWETDTTISEKSSVLNVPAPTFRTVGASDDTITSCSKNIQPSAPETVARYSGQNQHPRRTNRLQESPPSLIRQNNRKVNFVDNLVDSASQIVECIWPLSVVSSRDTGLNNKGVLPLRTFIQETLRRSRTSYSTLQVALYYLILIKSHIPEYDFTMEQPADGQSLRAMQCGRRMFLAALILASKYLQDRNYSSRAWSKISGLNPTEINMNELAFLAAVKWRLHISEKIFQRWTDVVLKYTPSTQFPRSPTSSPTCASGMNDWKSVIPKLTPELNTVDIASHESPITGRNLHSNLTPPLTPVAWSGTLKSNPTLATPVQLPISSIPRVLEPVPCLARLGPLPTPSLTPLSSGFRTPAVSAKACAYGKKSSIGSALVNAENLCTARMTLDCINSQQPRRPARLEAYALRFRRPSVDQSPLVSSPESMISDNSSRSSRSSSISSVASSICAPSQLNLAVQATCRSATLQQTGRNEHQRSPSLAMPFLAGGEVTSSPESYSVPTNIVPDFSKFSLCTPQPTPLPSQGLDVERDFAVSGFTVELRDITDKPKAHPLRSTRIAPKSTMKPAGCKRGRSSDNLTLQQCVRGLTASRIEDDRMVLPDRNVADSFLLRSSTDECAKALQVPSRMSSARLPLEKEAGRKRACCTESQARVLSNRMPGPGMWDGIL